MCVFEGEGWGGETHINVFPMVLVEWILQTLCMSVFPDKSQSSGLSALCFLSIVSSGALHTLYPIYQHTDAAAFALIGQGKRHTHHTPPHFN